MIDGISRVVVAVVVATITTITARGAFLRGSIAHKRRDSIFQDHLHCAVVEPFKLKLEYTFPKNVSI